MSRAHLLFFLFPLFLFGCSEETPDVIEEDPNLPLTPGVWYIAMDLGEETLPFNIDLEYKTDHFELWVMNSEERIHVKDISFKEDSIFIRMPFFDSEFRGVIESKDRFSGNWYNFNKGVDYFIPFVAIQGRENRFRDVSDERLTRIEGNWEVTFSPGVEGDEYKAVGSFEQFGSHLMGTFMTETGDYRFLDGLAYNDSLYLSCFDGAHAFLFKAALDESDTLKGLFWSGTHWSEPWLATRNEMFELRHPDSLTYLKEGYDSFDFTFPDVDSNMVSLSDEKFQDKVVIVQIMGTWCPNCLDETMLYVDLYNEFNTSGLEIVSLAFEASPEFAKASENVRRLRDRIHVSYDMLVAGVSNKKKASETLPMLNHVMSYPTSIFIDRSGRIRRIHTGFYGPGTGDHYVRYVEELKGYLQMLLDEESS